MAMDAKKRWVLFSGLTSFFLSIAMLYQMSPFFQMYAEKTAGASAGTVGLIFAVLPTASFIFAVPASKFIARAGHRIALASGLLLLAISSLLFGLSDSVTGWVVWRFFQGAASAPIYSAVACMFANTFTGPGEFAWVNSMQEAMANIGFAVGPMLGGFLFQWGGFFAPFAVSGFGHLLFVGLSLCTPGKKGSADGKDEPLVEQEEVTHLGVRDVMYGEILMVVPAGIIIPGIFGALDPVLASHLVACLGEVDPSTIGTLIAIPSVPSTLLALVVPKLMERYTADRVMTVGVILLAVCSALMGLSDPDSRQSLGWSLPLPPGSSAQWIFQVLLFACLGISSALGWTPVLPDMMEKAVARVTQHRNVSREVATQMVSPAVSALFNGGAAIGEAAGPIFGGMLLSRLGFGLTYVVLGSIFAVYAIALVCVPMPHQMEDVSPSKLSIATKLRAAVSFGPDVGSPSSNRGRVMSL